MGRGRSKCPSYHPPTPYTFSPPLKGGEGRDEGGAYTHVPCPFGALLVTLYHLKSKAFLRGGHARLKGERQIHITLPSYMQKPFARNWYKTRSGKIMRRILRKIATGERDFGDTSTLADPAVVEVLWEGRRPLPG